MAYAATFDVQQPQQFDKAQVALRILMIIFLGWVFDAVLNFAYLALPVVAAVLISQRGAEQYHAEAEAGPSAWNGRRVVKGQIRAYMCESCGRVLLYA